MTEAISMQKVKVRGQSQGHRGQNPIQHFPDCNSSLNSHMAMKWWTLRRCALCFFKSSVKFQGHTADKLLILTQIGRFRTVTPFEFTNGCEMMHKAWISTEEVPYCFSRSSFNFQGHTGQKSRQFWPRLNISGLELQFQFTDGFEMMDNACQIIEEVFYCFSMSSFKFPGNTVPKIKDLNPI